VPEPDLADPDYFELSLTRFAPEPVTLTRRIRTVAELDEHLIPAAGEATLCVGLTCVAEEAEWGAFCLLLGGTRGYVHLQEGPCLTACDPASAVPDGGSVHFLDDGGNCHEIALRNTVAREQGLRALRHWMPHGERLPELIWRPA
jgi:hypothetical protein